MEEVRVTDIDMKFFTMVLVMVKVSFAAIPAVLIIALIWGLISVIFSSLNIGLFGLLGKIL